MIRSITILILAVIMTAGLVTSTPVGSANILLRDVQTPWSEANCTFAILYGKLILSTRCKEQYSALDLNTCFMNNDGFIGRRSHGGFTASCIGCDFSDNKTLLTCQCLKTDGQTRVFSSVALDDAVWVDETGFLHCFETVGFPSSGNIDIGRHTEQRASITTANEPQIEAAYASPDKDEAGTAGVHATYGSALRIRDDGVPLGQAHCDYLTLDDDYKLSGECGPPGTSGGQCSELWLDECFQNDQGSLRPLKNGGYPGSCNRCTLVNDDKKTLHCACERGADQTWWVTEVSLANNVYIDSSNVLSCFDNHGRSEWCTPAGGR